ncbi:uncharacterized protein [Antedon mediterranea]|uniref:uncharacterized protein n=1 Tax=Antedon mediterranea TaxID=105859 RepID=UPI003AF6317D
MDCRNKDILRSCRVQLSQDLTIEELWNPLVEVGLFTPPELQRINRPSSGIEDAMTRLLDALEQKGPLALKDFKTALTKGVNKPHLLDLLNQNVEQKERKVEIYESELSLLVKLDQRTKDKKMELKDFLNATCLEQDDGSFKITKEDRNTFLEELDNLDKINDDGTTIFCGVCVCTGDNPPLCSTSNRLQVELDKVKAKSTTMLSDIQKVVSNMLISSGGDDTEETISGEIKMDLNKLVFDIENDKESFA